ncbi:nuclear transport factor 2 family protein [Flavivirga jejuensis]|uniref:Nuclear transport factor 2 family protein n=1 Tax=Flavivirga jejuensis TaxID=870487 RepID=A0ABT8WLK0_9FLAO|nr:nuclear transport factor 2 family protein [Flavivirga jejuensis]MDO5974024.1 nuclear transport factor 2 family protein [Flavivirga jejuensis]
MIKNRAEETFKNHLACLSQGKISDWSNLFAKNGVLEVPYAPKGFPKKVEGRTALYDYMKNFPEQFKVTYKNLNFHPTANPNLAIVEFDCEGVALSTKNAFIQKYISIVTTNDAGEIIKYVDYWNPIVIMESLGMM